MGRYDWLLGKIVKIKREKNELGKINNIFITTAIYLLF